MTDLDKIIFDEIKQDHAYVVEIRRFFHKNPEIAKEEFTTAKKIEDELEKIGLHHQRVAETGVYAEIHGEAEGGSASSGSGSGGAAQKAAASGGASASTGASPATKTKTIVLRADIDALPIQETHECEYKSTIPNRMHACGHDSHAASLLGAARILVNHKKDFSGTVKLSFQSGEEIGYGAKEFLDSGLLDGADRSFGLHAASNIPSGKIALVPGPNNASVDWFKITVNGKSAHVSTPQLGADAVYIASQIIVSLQAIITRRTSPMENVIIGVGKVTAGDAYNIVAQKAEIEGTIRAFSPKVRKEIKKELQILSKNIAQTFGAKAEVEFVDYTPTLINDEKATKEVQETASRVFGDKNIIKNRQPSCGGDNFANYILKIPGMYAYFGTGNPKKEGTTEAHHNSNFDIDEDALIQSVGLYTFYSLDYLK